MTTFASVWEALEEDPIKRENLKIRSELLSSIEKAINEQQLKPKELVKILGSTQPRISALMNGKINQFRIDMLVNYAHKLGLHVSIKAA